TTGPAHSGHTRIEASVSGLGGMRLTGRGGDWDMVGSRARGTPEDNPKTGSVNRPAWRRAGSGIFLLMRQDHSPSSDHASGRPLAGEYADYAAADIASVPGDDAVEALRHARAETLTLLRPLTGRSADRLPRAPAEGRGEEG